MKAFTDIEQSKKLQKILPIESADMYYHNRVDIPDNFPLPIEWKHSNKLLSQEIPCWSLAALLDVYPMIVGRDMDMYCCWQNRKNLHSKHYDNPVDACYEMILKLYELKMLL